MHRAFAALFVVLLSLLAARAEAAPRRFAVVVGANRGGLDEVQLRYAEKDAERIAQVLLDLGLMLPEDLILLRSPEADGVERVLVAMAERVAQRPSGQEAVLYVYYSGHGDPAALHLGRTSLGVGRLRSLVGAIPAEAKVLVLDACQSGSATRSKGASRAAPFTIAGDDGLATAGTAVITSSTADEDAQESDQLGGGIFSHHFVVGLSGAADDSKDGRVTLTEAYRYAYAATLRSSSRAAQLQHPTFSYAMKGRGGLVVTDLRRSRSLGQLALEAPGLYLVFANDEDGALVAELTLETPRTVAVAPGVHFVRRRTEDAAFERRVDIQAGRRTVLDADAMKEVPLGTTVRKGLATSERAAGAVVAGFELGGPLLDDLGPGLFGTLGMRFDFEPITMVTRLRYGHYAATNPQLALQQHMIGGDVAAVKLFDLGPLSPGLGVRLGVDWIHQRFDTTGTAPNRSNVAGRAGPLLTLGWAPTASLFVALDGGLDVYLLETAASGVDSRVVPYGMVSIGLYVF